MGMCSADLDAKRVEGWIKVDDKITPIYSASSLDKHSFKNGMPNSRPMNNCNNGQLDSRDIIHMISSDVKSIESDVFQMRLDLQVVLQYLREQQEDSMRMSEKRKPPPSQSLLIDGCGSSMAKSGYRSTIAKQEGTLTQWLSSRLRKKSGKQNRFKQKKKEKQIRGVYGPTIVCDPDTPSLTVKPSPFKLKEKVKFVDKSKDATSKANLTVNEHKKDSTSCTETGGKFTPTRTSSKTVDCTSARSKESFSYTPVSPVFEGASYTDTHSSETAQGEAEAAIRENERSDMKPFGSFVFSATGSKQSTQTGSNKDSSYPPTTAEENSDIDNDKTTFCKQPVLNKVEGDPFRNDMKPSVQMNKNATGLEVSGEFSFCKPVSGQFPQCTHKGQQQTSEDDCTEDHENGEDPENFEPDVYFRPVVTLPKQVDLETGEEDEDKLFGKRAKLYRFDQGQWKERGIGEMKIMQNRKTGTYRLLMRRDQVHKTCVNHCLTKDMELTALQTSKSAWCWYARDFSEGVFKAEHFAIRFKQKDHAEKFKEIFEECVAKTTNNDDTRRYNTDQTKQELRPSWNCDACFVHNFSGIKCVACLTPRPSTNTKWSKSQRLEMGRRNQMASTDTSTIQGPPVADLFSANKPVISGAQVPNMTHPSCQMNEYDRLLKTTTDGGSASDSLTSALSRDGDVDDDVIIVGDETPTLHDKTIEARKWKLPDSFYTYETRRPCRGCLGCKSDDFDFSTIGTDAKSRAAENDPSLETNQEEGEERVHDDRNLDGEIRPDEHKDKLITLFNEEAKLCCANENGNFLSLGKGDLKIIQDGSASGARIQMISRIDEDLCSHMICQNDFVKLFLDDRACEWMALDRSFGGESMKKFRAQFCTKDIARYFSDAFDKGVVVAQQLKL